MSKRSPIVAVDVDLTVVDSLKPWLQWFKAHTGLTITNAAGNYDIVPEMKQLCKDAGYGSFDPYAFWTKDDLYDDLEPIEGSVETLSRLNAKGCQIIFVSLCDPYHIKSKVAFLHRYFPFHKGFIDTAEKHYVKYDVIVDDREKHILLGMEHNPFSKHILYTGIARQTVKYNEGLEQVSHWRDIDVKVDRQVCEECGCDTSGWMQRHKAGCSQIPY